jgi:hypothetical protein
VTLTNSGGLTLQIGSISINGGPFSQTNNCGTALGPGASCNINITFAPTAAGNFSATLTIADNLRAGPTTVALSGTGVVPTVGLSANALDFGTVVVGASTPAQTVTVTNTSTVTLAISSIAINPPFSQTNNCGSSLAAGASCTINVSLATTAAGVYKTSLAIADNGANSPQTVTLMATVQDFGVTANPTAATVRAGSSASYTISVSGLNGAGFGGSVSLACTGLPALSACTFSPTSVTPGSGTATSTLTISTTAPSGLGPRLPGQPPTVPLLLTAGLLGLLAWTLLCRRGRLHRAAAALAGIALVALALGTLSCGGGGSSASAPHNPGTPTGTYSVTVTGTSGQLQHATTVSLTVQ